MNVAAKLGQSVSLLQRGQLQAAENLCREIILSEPTHADAVHVLGIITLRQGRLEPAIELLRNSLALNPVQPYVRCNLGNALRDLKQPAEALANYRQAIQLAPEFAGAYYGQGNALVDLSRLQEALESFDRAIAIEPEYADAHQNRGNALLSLGRIEDALESYERALHLQPTSPGALENYAYTLRRMQRPLEALAIYERMSAAHPGETEPLISRGNLLLELGRYEEAMECFDRVLQRRPDTADTLYNRGHARLAVDQFERALADFDRLLQLEPELAEAHCSRGRTLIKLDRFEEALASLTATVRLKPGAIDALDGSGMALRALGRLDEARTAFEQALEQAPGNVDILYRFAVTLRESKRHEDAARAFAQVVALAPDYDYALGNLLHERVQMCDWSDYASTLTAIEAALHQGKRTYLPGPFFAVSDSASAQLQCARIFVADKRLGTGPEAAPASQIHRHDRIRVAYISADLREHPVSHLIAGVLESHDRRRFEITGVSLQPEELSPIGQRIRGAFDQFIDVSRCSDTEVIALLRELEIDIAVDLMGFSGGGRPTILAARPAPVQVNYLGFSGTMGASYIDYIIADRVVIPDGDRSSFTENVVYLPHCFQPNDAKRSIAARKPTRSENRLPEQSFVFCCFNSAYKISPTIFDIWMRLLDQVEGSVLWLAAADDTVSRNLRREAMTRNVAPERLVFAPRRPDLAEHLARYALADLFMDTLPYNAHTTASDALWAGLPVLTCRGAAFAGRVAASLLETVGLSSLIVENLVEYETLAYQLATTPSLLHELRGTLAASRLSSPLFDTGRYCRHLESAYESMYERAVAGGSPRDIIVSDVVTQTSDSPP